MLGVAAMVMPQTLIGLNMSVRRNVDTNQFLTLLRFEGH